MAVEDPGIAVEIVKIKFKNFIKTVLKVIAINFFSYALVLVIVVVAVGAVFEIFASVSDLLNPFDVNVKEMEEWANSLTDEDIEKIQNYGASIHPRKLPKYVKIEEESYPKNVNIQIPVITKVWINGSLSSTRRDYNDYLLKRGDIAYPYRQWWQSTAGLDAINDTALYENKLEIVENAERDLKPIFTWANPEVPLLTEGSKYQEGSGMETVITTTTVVVESVSGGPTTTKKTEVKEYYPIEFLKEVETMFAKHLFELKETISTDSTTSHDYYYITETETVIDENGQAKEVKHRKRVDVTTTVTVTVTGYEIGNENKEYIEKFLMFLYENGCDINSDPEIMYYMAELLPQSHDFISQYGEYLMCMENMPIYSDFPSDFDFSDYTGEGGVLLWPVPGYKRISSYYGYRIHPVLKTKKLHTGIDIPAPTGTPVLAAEGGVVIYSGYKGSYGIAVMIDHGNGIVTLYGHNSKVAVKKGDKVRKGQVIALVGSTGRSTGPHSHFEVRKNGKHTNPLPWVVGN